MNTNNADLDLLKETRMGLDQETINEIIDNIYHYLCKHKEYLNGLNVFPVPDGDTGLNMVLTLQGAIGQMKKNKKNYIRENISKTLPSRCCSTAVAARESFFRCLHKDLHK